MCGIFAILNNEPEIVDNDFVKRQFMKSASRGPDNSVYKRLINQTHFGFHRLAINGLNDESNQPICIDNIVLICNGEIYNYKELYELIDVIPNTESDCEIIIHLYKKFGIEYTLQLLDGVFAFMICDYDYNMDTFVLYIARDPYGVRPLFSYKPFNSDIILFASELKNISQFTKVLYDYNIQQFHPGTYSIYTFHTHVKSKWKLEKENVKYHSTGFNSIIDYNHSVNTSMDLVGKQTGTEDCIFNSIQYYLMNAVKKRVLISDRPIACLLSGGLDSSLITSLVNDIYKKTGNNNIPLETYSIGMEGSEDLYYARYVSEYLGTKHTEIKLTEQEFIDAIPEVIYAIESYDTTTVRASIGNYLLGKYISKHSKAKIVFNGDGSDELCGGYLYMHACPNSLEFDKECRRLLQDIHMFDVLRSDKCISSHGLEPRTPFLDRSWVQSYLSIHPNIRYHPRNNQCEKWLLRTAFSKDKILNHESKPFLPDEVLWRRKEAFSDGVSKTTKSLYQMIQEYVETIPLQTMKNNTIRINPPKTTEQRYYRNIYENHFTGLGHLTPYFWMPKYVDATDASARTLQIYKTPK